MTKRLWELVVGLFVAVGIFLTLSATFRFARDIITKTYPISIHINDVGGLEKGDEVELGGLKIGYVSETPYFKEDYTGLIIPLKIKGKYKIPKSSFPIVDTTAGRGSFVTINLPKEKVTSFVDAEEIINGIRINRDEPPQNAMGNADPAQLEKLVAEMAKGGNTDVSKLLESLKGLDPGKGSIPNLPGVDLKNLSNLPNIANIANLPIPGGTMPDLSNMANLQQMMMPKMPVIDTSAMDKAMNAVTTTMDSVESSNQKMSKSIEGFDKMVLSSGSTIENIDKSMVNLDGSMDAVGVMAVKGQCAFDKLSGLIDDNTELLTDFHLAINQMRGLMCQVEPLVVAVRKSDGLLKTLVEDEQFDMDVRCFIHKAERNGLIFYPPKLSGPSKGISTTSSSRR